MTRLDILHLVTRSQRRGAELVALELARQLDALGHNNRVVALSPGFDGSTEDALPPLVRQRGSGIIAFFASVRALRRELGTTPVDVVLAHGGRPYEVAVHGRRGPAPLVVWQRILPFPAALWKWPRRWRWRRAARAGDAAVVLSSDLDGELRRLDFRGPIWTIPNFRDPERFSQVDRGSASAALRSELGIDGGAGLIGLVGHLIRQKRPERALDVLAEVHALGEDAHLVVAGEGPLRAQLERDAGDRGLATRVHFLGERRDIELVLGGIDALVLTSESEGVPGVLIEALMVGCPAVTVRLGGVATIV